MQNHHGPVFGCEQPEGLLELVTRDDTARHVGRRRWVHRESTHSGDPPALATRVRVTGVDDESMEPCLEPLRVAQRRQVAPGADGAPASSRPGLDAGPAGSDKRARSGGRRMRRPATRTRPDHRRSPVPRGRPARSAPVVRGPSGRFTEYGAGRRRNVHIRPWPSGPPRSPVGLTAAALGAWARDEGRTTRLPPFRRGRSSRRSPPGRCHPTVATPTGRTVPGSADRPRPRSRWPD